MSDESYSQTFNHTGNGHGYRHNFTVTGLSPDTEYTFHVVSYYKNFTLSDSIYSFNIFSLACTGKHYIRTVAAGNTASYVRINPH